MLISICICTHKRPQQLDFLLGRIAQLDFPGGPAECEVVVVDNDPGFSSQPVLLDWASKLPVALRYENLPKPNISLARNRVVAMAGGEFLLLIDDDQYPDGPIWVHQLLQTHRDTQAQVIFGPILPVFDERSPDWIRQGRFFDQPSYEPGAPVPLEAVRGGNVLLHRSCFQAFSPPFDESYGKTGAEDTLFFQELYRRGFRSAWCAEAVVHETVPFDRANTRWLTRRSYRIGQTWIRTSLHGSSGVHWGMNWCLLLLRSGALLVLSLLLTALSYPFSVIRGFYWWRKVAAQVGKLSSLFGRSYHEYR